MSADRIFTTPELQRRYSHVDISLLTPKCTLVPEQFFSDASARSLLEGVTALREEDAVSWVRLPELSSVLVFSKAPVLPEMYYLLRQMGSLEEYNKILASYMDGYLHLVIAQGRSLSLANVFRAPDFTTAQYFIFLAMKRLQLNPELSTIAFRTPLDPDAEMSLYRYFKSVIRL